MFTAPGRALDALVAVLGGVGGTVLSGGAATGAQGPMASTRYKTKDGELLALFGLAAGNLRRTSELLDRLLKGWPDGQELRGEILDCEHLGDRITHDLIHQLLTAPPRTFDRDDVFGLAAAVDDVIDLAEEVADYLGLYQIEAPMDSAQQLAGVLRETCACLADALEGLDDVRGLRPLLIDIHRLENEADRIVRSAISSLFVGGIDPTVIIRWKDLFERLENAIDSCEKAAHILEGIAVKHA
jgi:predicted phosphate transport protein (TIGR00153 family)